MLLYVLLYVLATVYCVHADCPVGTIRGLASKQCYLYDPKASSWYDAEESCQRQGGHLASASNGFVNSFILENVGSMVNAQDVWLGGSSGVTSAVNWVWSDGSQFTYADWTKGEPKQNVGATCLVGNVTTHKWNAQSCDDNRSFICEVPALVDAATCSTPVATSCPPAAKCPACPSPPSISLQCPVGWTYIYTTRNCYKLVYGTPEGAEALCQKESAIVADIHSDAENNWITDFASQSMNGDIDVVIIGLYAYKKNCDWHWWNWTPINYVNWHTDQPKWCVTENGWWWAVAVTNPDGWLASGGVPFRKWSSFSNWPAWAVCKKRASP